MKVVELQGNSVSRRTNAKNFLIKYLYLVPFWIILEVLVYSSGIGTGGWINTQGVAIVFVGTVALFSNPVLAAILLYRDLKKSGKKIVLLNILLPCFVALLLTIILIISPWIYSTAQEIIYENADKETIQSIKTEARAEKEIKVKVRNYFNRVEPFDSDWVEFVIYLDIVAPEGVYIDKIQAFLERVKFNRETKIFITWRRPNEKENEGTHWIYKFDSTGMID